MSIYSVDDQMFPISSLPRTQIISSAGSSKFGAVSTRAEADDENSVTPTNLKQTLTNPSISSDPPSPNPELTNTPGYRAAEAYIRPAPIVTSGKIVNYGFDLKNCQFTLNLDAPQGQPSDAATVVFLPEYHFPKEQCTVAVSSGKWEICTEDEERAWVQKIRWWHADGPRSLKITGLIRPHNTAAGTAEEAGYLEQCQQSYGVDVRNCNVM